MALNFQEVRDQVRQLGEHAPQRAQELKALREKACDLLNSHATDLERLRQKVEKVAHDYDPSIRCALPVNEALNAHFPLPDLPSHATLLAADGSQIAPSRHEQVEYCLINVGAIQMSLHSSQAPSTAIHCSLLYDEELEHLTDATLALRRDLNERTMLADLASEAAPPVITLTDGQMELGIGKPGDSQESSLFQKSLQEYLQVLRRMEAAGVTTAGYVDKPRAKTVVRLLEIAMLPESELPEIKHKSPLRGVNDLYLYSSLLEPGERSSIFELQSQFAGAYDGGLALHFFYINVGRLEHPQLARVEIPAWVAQDEVSLNHLHAVLVGQCRIMGSRPFPYIVHRAHEAAVVTMPEKEQVTQMIVLELRKRGVEVEDLSNKQSAKNLPGRSAYKRV